ncbi:MAG: hypothetical protein QM644_15765 [Mobilitalea sp.]
MGPDKALFSSYGRMEESVLTIEFWDNPVGRMGYNVPVLFN